MGQYLPQIHRKNVWRDESPQEQGRVYVWLTGYRVCDTVHTGRADGAGQGWHWSTAQANDIIHHALTHKTVPKINADFGPKMRHSSNLCRPVSYLAKCMTISDGSNRCVFVR